MEKSLKDLLTDELRDLLSCEEQIIKALPSMVKASESPDLKQAFAEHLKETRGQLDRLKQIFKILKIQKKEKFCKGTKGLIDECKEVIEEYKTKSYLRDSALISKAQRIEHYEISAYGTVRTFANELGHYDVVKLLETTLNEEGNADKTLTKLAKGGLLTSGINHKANIDTQDVTKKVNTVKKSKVAPKRTKAIGRSGNNGKIRPSKKTKKI